MRKIITISALAMVSAAPAMADSLYDREQAPEVYQEHTSDTWTGLYMGVFGGYGWADWQGQFNYDDAYKYPALDFNDSEQTFESDNWLAGVAVGGDHQFDRLVLGVVADVAYSDLNAETDFKPYALPNPVTWRFNTEIEYFGTVRGRIGYLANDKLLVYGTGGLAWAMTNSSIESIYDAGSPKEFSNGHATAENNHIGWTAGAGFEWKLSDHVSFSTEYLYMDLGEQNYRTDGLTASGGGYATDHFDSDLEIHSVKAGLNFRY